MTRNNPSRGGKPRASDDAARDVDFVEEAPSGSDFDDQPVDISSDGLKSPASRRLKRKTRQASNTVVSSDEELSSEAPPKAKKQKGPKRGEKGKKQSLTEQLVASAQESSASTSSVASDVDPVTFNQVHKNTSKLDFLINQCGRTLRLNAVSNYTPTAGRLLHVSELEIWQGRRWEIVDIELHTITRGDDTFPVWWLKLQDKSGPGSSVIIPFRLDPRGERKRITRNKVFFAHGPYPISEDGCLEMRVCPSYKEATKLCLILCDILDRFPEDLPVDNWNATWGHGGYKGASQNPVRFVEMAALFKWQKQFDGRRLGEPFRPYTKSDKRRGAYGQML